MVGANDGGTEYEAEKVEGIDCMAYLFYNSLEILLTIDTRPPPRVRFNKDGKKINPQQAQGAKVAQA